MGLVGFSWGLQEEMFISYLPYEFYYKIKFKI